MEVDGYAPEVQYIFNTTPSVGHVYKQIARVLPEHELRPIIDEINDTYKKDYQYQTKMAFSTYWMIRGLNTIQPLLNEKLKRPANFPTLNNLMAYAMRNYIWYTQEARALMRKEPRNPDWKVFEGNRGIH